MKFIGFMFLMVFLSGCAQGKYQIFYQEFIDTESAPEIQLLSDGAEPRLHRTDDMTRDIKTLESKNYVIIGRSVFYSSLEDIEDAVVQARRIGATIVLVRIGKNKTEVVKESRLRPLGKTLSRLPKFRPNPSGQDLKVDPPDSQAIKATSAGLSLTEARRDLPALDSQRSFAQEGIYLALDTKKYKFGVGMIDLNSDEKVALKRRAGAKIYNVLEDSAALKAGLQIDDVLIAKDGRPVENAEQAMQMMLDTDPGATSSVLTIIRNGVEERISVEFD